MSIPVVIAANGYGLPVKAVTSGAPKMVVSPSGYGIPIVISDFGVPFIVDGLVAAAPAAFGVGDWSLSNPATGGQLNVGISSLPSNGGSAITDVEYRVNGGSWTSSGGTVGFSITGLTDDVSVNVELRAVNAVGAGAGSDTKSATPTAAATAPIAFTAGQWSVADATTGGQVNVTISALPDDGGATITDIEYQVDAGAWTSSGGTSDFNITGLTDDVQIDLKIRAVNSVGSGAASDTKAVTPTEADTTAPFINTMTFNAGTGSLDIGYTETNLPTAARWHVRLQSSGAPDEPAMLDGTGALDSGSFSSATTTDTEAIALDSGLTADDYTMYVMISDPAGNHSNIASDNFTLATAPDAFATGDWSIADAGTGGAADVTIADLPAANNATITDVEYSIDNGTWTSSGGTTDFQIPGLTNGVSAGVEIRAVNSEGAGPDGVSKSVTPTAASGGSASHAKTETVVNITSNETTFTGSSYTPAAGSNRVLLAVVTGYEDVSGQTPVVSAITYAGSAMTELLAPNITANARAWVAVYAVNEADVITGTFSMTMTATQRAMAVTLVQVNDADQTLGNIWAGNNPSNSSVAALDLTRSAAAGSVLVGGLAINTGGLAAEIAATGGATLDVNSETGTAGSSDVSFGVLHKDIASAASETLGFSWIDTQRANLVLCEVGSV